MKRNLIIVLLIAILVLSTFLTGCNMARNGNLNNDINDIVDSVDEVDETPEVPEPTEDEENEDSSNKLGKDEFDPRKYESIISEEETPYTLIKEDGEKVYLSETSPEVVALTMAVADYGKAICNVNWETATGREGCDLLTPEGKKGYEEEGVEQIALEFYNDYKVVMEFLGVEKYNFIEINGDIAIVDVVYSFVYNNVEDLANYKPGITYYAPEKMRFKLIDGKWLVDRMLESRQRYSYEEE